jgi:hypothetical protein
MDALTLPHTNLCGILPSDQFDAEI